MREARKAPVTGRLRLNAPRGASLFAAREADSAPQDRVRSRPHPRARRRDPTRLAAHRERVRPPRPQHRGIRRGPRDEGTASGQEPARRSSCSSWESTRCGTRMPSRESAGESPNTESGFRFVVPGPVGEGDHWGLAPVQVVAVAGRDGQVAFFFCGLLPRCDRHTGVGEEIGDAFPDIGGACPGEDDLHTRLRLQERQQVQQGRHRGHGVDDHEDLPALGAVDRPGAVPIGTRSRSWTDMHFPRRCSGSPRLAPIERTGAPSGVWRRPRPGPEHAPRGPHTPWVSIRTWA